MGGLSVEQVLELAALRDDKLFHFYDDLNCLDQEPHGYRTAYEDDIGVTEEVYCRLTFYNCRIRSVSLSVCLSVRPSVTYLTVGLFLRILKYINPLKRSGVRRLHFEVFGTVQV